MVAEEKKIKYLYIENIVAGLCRHKIIKETKTSYFLKNDEKVSKNKMFTNTGYRIKRYMAQTTELDTRYKKQKLASKAKWMLEELVTKTNFDWLSDNMKTIEELYNEWRREI